MTLCLFPNLLSSNTPELFPEVLKSKVLAIQGLFAESAKEGRRFLSYFMPHAQALKVPICVLKKQPSSGDYAFYLEPLKQNETWGMVSDAGLPCIADPGSALVAYARKEQVKVEAYPGPSSLFLTLMLSGIYSQKFSFKGYPSKDPQQREAQFALWEKESLSDDSSILFIETPFRNQFTFEALLKGLDPNTLLCVATAITSSNQKVATHSVFYWKKLNYVVDKEPTVFLFKALGYLTKKHANEKL